MLRRKRPARGTETPSPWAADPRVQVVLCPSCGLRNELSARFCRNCGLPLGVPGDPVRGVSPRRADLPSEHGSGIAAAIGLVLVVAVLGISGFLVIRGTNVFGGGGRLAVGSATIEPGPVTTPATSPSGAPDSATPPAPSPEPLPSAEPPSGPTGAPSPAPEPGKPAPSPQTDATAVPRTTPGTRTGFTCDPASIVDPGRGKWRVARYAWRPTDRTDQVTIELERQSGRAKPALKVTMESMTASQVRDRLGLEKPAGKRVIVVSFEGPAFIRSEVLAEPALATLKTLHAQTDKEGVVRVVLGVSGDGCSRLTAPGWEGDQGGSTAEIVLDIRR